MKIVQNTKFVSLVAALVVFSGCSSIRGWEPEDEGVQESTEAPMEQEVDNEPAEIDTSVWQTYTNEEYGFSFDYPADWNLIISSSEETHIIGNDRIKLYIQNYDNADPHLDTLLYSQETLTRLNEAIISEGKKNSYGVPFFSKSYKSMDINFMRFAELVIDSNYYTVSMLYSDCCEYNETVDINSFNTMVHTGDLLTTNEKYSASVFDHIVDSIRK